MLKAGDVCEPDLPGNDMLPITCYCHLNNQTVNNLNPLHAESAILHLDRVRCSEPGQEDPGNYIYKSHIHSINLFITRKIPS